MPSGAIIHEVNFHECMTPKIINSAHFHRETFHELRLNLKNMKIFSLKNNPLYSILYTIKHTRGKTFTDFSITRMFYH